MYTVDSAADKLQFVALAADVAALSLAAYLCELLRLLAPVDEDAGDFLSLALTALHLLNAGGDRRIVKSAFELKLLSLAGYMPGLDGCRLCGAPGGRAIAFDPLRGDFVWGCRSTAAARRWRPCAISCRLSRKGFFPFACPMRSWRCCRA